MGLGDNCYTRGREVWDDDGRGLSVEGVRVSNTMCDDAERIKRGVVGSTAERLTMTQR